MTDAIELAKQSGIRWDAESDCSEWRLRRSELEALVALVRNAALEEAAHVCDVQADGHDDDASCENDQDYKSRYLVYAKHERRCAAVIRNLKERTP